MIIIYKHFTYIENIVLNELVLCCGCTGDGCWGCTGDGCNGWTSFLFSFCFSIGEGACSGLSDLLPIFLFTNFFVWF